MPQRFFGVLGSLSSGSPPWMMPYATTRMEGAAVVVALAREGDELLDVLGRLVGRELEAEGAEVGGDDGLEIAGLRPGGRGERRRVTASKVQERMDVLISYPGRQKTAVSRQQSARVVEVVAEGR